VASLAISTLLKTCNEDSVQKLLRQIANYLPDLGIDFKIEIDLNDIYSQSEKYFSVKQFFEIMIKNTNRELNMIEIGRNSKFYDMMEDQRSQVEQTNVSVIQGFLTSVDLYQKGLFLQIDFVSRCL
jgi:aubergine-like protein